MLTKYCIVNKKYFTILHTDDLDYYLISIDVVSGHDVQFERELPSAV